jgi:hypothetical protein
MAYPIRVVGNPGLFGRNISVIVFVLSWKCQICTYTRDLSHFLGIQMRANIPEATKHITREHPQEHQNKTVRLFRGIQLI